MDCQERGRTQRGVRPTTDQHERRFDATATSLSEVRCFVTGIVGDDVADLELVVSELATNAVQHGEGPITVRVAVNGDTVRVAVHDAGERYPAIAQVPSNATHGRGLAIVAAACTEWGVTGDDDGKWVWAEVGRSDGSTE